MRVFLSSPGDVVEERNAAREILEKLAREPLLRGRVTIEVISWDDPDAPAPMLANLSPQDAVNRGLPTPAMCDLTVAILWGRFGTPLTQPLKKDGTAYRSGTEWEFENALEAGKDVLLYRRSSDVQVKVDDPEFEAKREQKRLVDEFFLQLRSPDGSLRAGYTAYATVAQFTTRLRHDIEALLARLLTSTHGEESYELVRSRVEPATMSEPQVTLSETEKWSEAERLFRKDAELGNTNAMINVGLIVKDRSPEEAAMWFKKAADVGNVDAMFDLGMLLKERDPPEAEHWLRNAAEAGDLSGMAQLAYLLITRDPTEAEKWLRKAAAGGVEYAMTDLGLLLMDRKAEEAEVWVRRAAKANDPRGMYNYGLLIEKRDPEVAKSWFRKAAEAGGSEARLRMLDLD